MPTAGKIFLYRESLTFEEIYSKLNGYEMSITYEELGKTFNLITDINLRLLEKSIEGLYSYDSVTVQYHRSGPQVFPKTTDAPFIFKKHGDSVFLIIIAKKTVANNVANELSKILHGQVGAIIEPVISSDAIKGFYRGAEGTKIMLLQDIVIPNMNKLTLYGDNVIQTDLFGEYINEGSPWYVVAKTLRRGYTVGLVGDGSVTIFNSVDRMMFLDYIEDEIFPLVLR